MGQLKRRSSLRIELCICLSLSAAAPAATRQDHVLPLAEMQSSAAKLRRKRLDKVSGLLSLPQVRQALSAAKLDVDRIQQAAALLSDAELSRLARDAEKARMDIEGGSLTNQELTYVVIALATALVVTLIFIAR